MDFRLALKPLGDLTGNRLRTTLLPPSVHSKFLHSALTTVLIKGKGVIHQVAENARDLPTPCLWQNHIFQSIGKNQSMRTLPPQIDESKIDSLSADPVESWLNKTSAPSEMPADPFTAAPPAEENPQPVQSVGVARSNKTTKRIRKVKDSNTVWDKDNATNNASIQSRSSELTTFDPDSRQANAEHAKNEDLQTEDLTRAQHKEGTALLQPWTRTNNVSSLPEDTASSTISEAINASLPGSTLQAPKIAPPVMPSKSVTSQTSAHSITAWDSHVVSGGNAVTHDILGFATTPPSEHRPNDGATSKPRKTYNTMRQQANSSPVGKSALMKKYDGQLCSILATIRARSGKVGLKFEFGRILLDAQSVPSQLTTQSSFTQGEWASAFNQDDESGRIQSLFTNR